MHPPSIPIYKLFFVAMMLRWYYFERNFQLRTIMEKRRLLSIYELKKSETFFFIASLPLFYSHYSYNSYEWQFSRLATPNTPTILKTWTIIDSFFLNNSRRLSLSPFLLKNRCEDLIDFHIKGLVKLTLERRIDMLFLLETHIH